MFIEASFKIVSQLEVTAMSPTIEWVNKLWYIVTPEILYTATRKNTFLAYLTTWIKLADIMPSEMRKSEYGTTPFI